MQLFFWEARGRRKKGLFQSATKAFGSGRLEEERKDQRFLQKETCICRAAVAIRKKRYYIVDIPWVCSHVSDENKCGYISPYVKGMLFQVLSIIQVGKL